MRNKTGKAPRIAVLALIMTGCELIGPQLHEKLPLSETTLIPEQENPASEMETEPVRTTQVEVFPSTEQSINKRSSTQTDNTVKAKGEYSLNFDDADLGEVAKVILSDILGKNYTLSPQVTGKVTLQTTQPLSKADLIPTLEMLLSINNAALVVESGMYLIKPANEAMYASSFKIMGSPHLPSGFQTHVVPVHNVAASEIADILKPLLPEKALLHVDPNRNILLVSGSASELNRMEEIVGIFDIDVLRGRSFALFTPAHVDASTIIQELEQVFNRASKADKADDNSFFRFIEIERLNAILAITQNPKYLHDIESWVLRLDRTSNEVNGGVNVYRAQHVNAVDLADTLSQIFGGGQGKSRSASIASGRKSLSATNKQQNNKNGNNPNNKDTPADKTLSDSKNQDKTLNRSNNTGSGGSSSAEMPNVKIIADEGNNALVIVANSEEYAKIQRVIKQLDVLPLQVMIDATIVEVTLNDDLQYGIEWYLTHNNEGINEISGGANQGFDISKIATGVATGGFSYVFSSGSKDINALLKSEATNNNINVISSPSLMVLNNQEASIKVGDSVPIRSSVSSNLSSTSTAGIVQTSSIQMIDTGINLSVRPRVNAGGLVLMDILQSVNQAITTTTSTSIDSPTIQKREIETSVAVQSGGTIVLGGLIKENNDYKRFGVPLLHEIPILGSLFGSTTRNKDKTELVVLLTPRVMKSRQDAQDITDEFKRKLSGIYTDYQESSDVDADYPQP